MIADTYRIRMTFWTFLRLSALFAVRGTLPSCENRNLKNEWKAQAISSSELFKQLDPTENRLSFLNQITEIEFSMQ
jgi:hypothetical protein